MKIRVDSRLVSYLSILLVMFLLSSERLQANEVTDVSLMAGYRQDSLDWNIASASGPNVLSELTWRDLKTFQIRGDITSINNRGVYLRGSAAYGWVLSGENQDSDYAGVNRTMEFSRSINDVDGSRMMDLKGGVGFTVPFGINSRHYFAPVFGFAYHSQRLNMTDGRQVLSNLAHAQIYNPNIVSLPPLGPIAGLNSSYDATWIGSWLGADFSIDLEGNGTLLVRLEHHWSAYTAEANWNLRDDFDHPVSFEHDADGRGLLLELGWKSVILHQDWQWGANISWQHWNTGAGTDRTYVTYYYDNLGNLVVCTPYCVGKTRLNEVNWSSSQINITFTREIDL